MKRILMWAIVGLTLFQLPLLAQDKHDIKPPVKEPEVDMSEVIRRGNMVEELGTGFHGEDVDIGEALAPPADDSHKWYISVITQAACVPCERLKADFMEKDALRAWVNVDDDDKSWAHYQVFRWEDTTQKWRWENIKVKAFPTLLIQPPRNGKYGPNKTVVAQITGYDGNPDKLTAQMSDAIKKYVRHYTRKHKLFRQPVPVPTPVGPPQSPPFEGPYEFAGMADAPVYDTTSGGWGQQGQIGVDPPFDVGPKIDPRYPNGPVVDIPPPITQEASLEQLRQYCPGCDDKFITEQLAQHATLEQAITAWRLRQTPSTIPFGMGRVLAFVGIAIGVLFFVVVVLVLLTVGFFVLRRVMATAAAPRPVASADAAPVAGKTTAGLTEEQYRALRDRIEQDIKA